MRKLGAVLAAALVVTLAPAASAETPSPQVIGPVTGGHFGIPFTSSPVPMPGYTEQEFFFGGTATGYVQQGTWTDDGRWDVTPAEQAPYETRMLVRRPTDPHRFNGTVVVEWLNVTAGIDVDPDFQYYNAELLRAGYAWVGISAQAVGVTALQHIDPARYGTLSHPGDTFSYDIFSQAAEALKHPGGVDPLGGLKPKALIADGESQSSLRMVTYANAIQPRQHLYDGFLVHSRRAVVAPISQAPQADQPGLSTWTRTDLDVPVLTVQTETDVLAPVDYFPATQPDNPEFRLWEIPGTSHLDAHQQQLGEIEIKRFLPDAPFPQCALPANDGQERYLMNSALARLDAWVRYGIAPPKADRIAIAGDPPAMLRDQYGNALGGIRTPALQAPASTLTGTGNTGSSPFCALWGTTTPFTAQQLQQLYPTHGDYPAAVTKAAAKDTLDGFLLPLDAALIVQDAAH
ncbi:alpha/beta hydrolase domain-containing protein [Kutzneria buriramensis]|uniref:Alpha/beta hydrolase domain-containing protein n=1 Tax=Kutzneria buriramensis TaxID=1045776 RepID=A0A3E0HEY6_9PSEU|nr:alpha/beta hydrolase domain-containing protein [Kutzneria buriramensis]REH43802.1 hypothetical protein BCF44_109345 [Kutzneria buriramensis]